MEIKSNLINNSTGEPIEIIYQESNPLDNLDRKTLQGVHAFCFCGDKMVLVKHPSSGWTPPGGDIEKNETYEEATIREVKEETNMDVISQEIIGFQDIYEKGQIIRQTRSYCKVESCGKFEKDPDDDIEEIKLIDPKNYREYFDWGEIGDRIMERAIELNKGSN
ncbi:MAG: 8-oxo-dGTP diphosphatase [Candidatus Paceibacteria bacterium]|jgi:8-oxo-dGTP diphosphatase